jgi:hypothetical protein
LRAKNIKQNPTTRADFNQEDTSIEELYNMHTSGSDGGGSLAPKGFVSADTFRAQSEMLSSLEGAEMTAQQVGVADLSGELSSL